MARKNEFSLSEAIDAFLDSNGIKEKALVERVIGDWERIMGKSVADNTLKVWFSNGILYVKMGHPAWKNEMMLSKTNILEMLNKELGASLIKELRLL